MNIRSVNSKIKVFLKWLFSRDGVIVTLLIGILVSFLSERMQDVIQRQRYLELLQYEVRYQIVDFGSLLNDFNKNKLILNRYYLRDDVFRSGLSNGYILSVDPKILPKLINFYDFVPAYNQILRQSYDGIDRRRIEWEDCVFALVDKSSGNCDYEKGKFDEAEKFYSAQIFQTWNSIYDNALKDVGSEFHPTQDRLDSPFLKLIMGKNTLEFLKK